MPYIDKQAAMYCGILAVSLFIVATTLVTTQGWLGLPRGWRKTTHHAALDVLNAVCMSLYDEFKRNEYAPPPLMKRMVTAGRLGRKVRQGVL